MANPQITTTPVSTAFSTTNTSTATTSATNWSAQSLTGPAVSSTNALSDGMNTTNIVQSNITRKVPYSNYSINFDAASIDSITINADLSSYSSITVSTWAKFVSSTGFQYVFDAGTYNASGPAGIKLSISKKQTTNEIATYDGLTNHSTGVNVALNTWYHITVTHAGTTRKVYLNGSLIGTFVSGNLNLNAINYIGRFSLNTNFMDGSISNVSIWNTELTEDDIIKLYNNGITQDLNNFRVTPNNWWPLDQSYTYFNGSVLVARDVISGNDGTGVNIIQENIVGNAPGSEASGTGVNLTIADLKGNMYNSDKNAYSINMADYADGVTNPANSGRSTDTPS